MLIADDESRLYWLAFYNHANPIGRTLLGVSIVRVTGRDANAIPTATLRQRGDSTDGVWLLAALHKAKALGIRPRTAEQIGAWVLPGDDASYVNNDRPIYPENTALTPEQIQSFGAIENAGPCSI